MAQPLASQYDPAQFIVEYYSTYVYNRNKIFQFYSGSSMIYRQSWQTNNISIPLNQCKDSFYFSNECDHITILNYTILPIPYGFLFVINGKIDSTNNKTVFFNQILQISIYGIFRTIIADYFSLTGAPLWSFPEFFDLYPPNAQSNEVASDSEITKQDEKINNQSEQKQPVSQVQQPAKQVQQQQPPPPQQQQQDYNNNNNGGRGKDNHRHGGYQRGRGRGGQRDLSERYGSSSKFTYTAPLNPTSNVYIPPTPK